MHRTEPSHDVCPSTEGSDREAIYAIGRWATRARYAQSHDDEPEAVTGWVDCSMEVATERGPVWKKPIRSHRSPARNRIG